MKSRANTHLYGYMRCLSTCRPATKEELAENSNREQIEYLLKSTFVKNKRTAANLCGVSLRTIERNLRTLIDEHLVEEGTIILDDKTYLCYYFPADYDGLYKLVQKELLMYLVNTRNIYAIRAYLYLLNCYHYKDDYEFTINEINTALGYAKTSTSTEIIIRDCLNSFKNEGVIDYEDTYISYVDETTGKTIQVPKKKLKFVATYRSQIKY